MEHNNRQRQRELHLSRVYEAPLNAVFDAWTQDRLVAQWWGPDGFTTPSVVSEPRPGGRFDIVMRGPDGVDYPMNGTYRAAVPNELILVDGSPLGADGKPALESTQRVEFASVGAQTKLDLSVTATALVPEAAGMLDGMAAGWNQSLQRLDDLLHDAVERCIVVPFVVSAHRERAFSAWVDKEKIGQWWGPKGFTLSIAHMDARPGGVWRYIMHRPDGKDYRNVDRYVEVRFPERLVFDHEEPPFRTIVTFDEMAGSTALSMRLVFPTTQERDAAVEQYGAAEGARQTLGKLQEFLK